MVTVTKRVTLEELERDGAPEGFWEVINGELIEMPPASFEHSWIGMRIGRLIGNYVDAHRLGVVFGADGGVVLAKDPLTLRAPDVGYVRHDRLPAASDAEVFLRVTPDLVVEIRSRFARSAPALAKAAMWLESGTALVWLVDAEAETVTVFAPQSGPRVVTMAETLDGGDILPGFTLPVRDIFTQ
ncbi:MAG: Uma2 family endonuclease [Chloroflexota bacterium]|nr:Uma2 family endonuclease [Chloroflexota bacterium]